MMLGLLAALSVQAQPAARPRAPSALSERIASLLATSGLDTVALSVIDLQTGQTVFARNPDLPLNPASNLKLLTAATAMIELGPEYRTRTGLYARVRDGAVEGGACLQGQGDPTLTRADLAVFAQRLLDEGVRKVDQVVIDGSYFDAAVLPPAFEQQPDEVAAFRAAVGAVSVNANAYTLRIRPGPTAGSPARVSVDGAGYFQIDNSLRTSAKTKPDVIAAEHDLGDRVSLSLTGEVPLGGGTLAYVRRVTSPLHYAGHVFVDALLAAGIQVPRLVKLDKCASNAALITFRNSPPLSEVLARLGKDSDNFVAEMVLKSLGAERKRKPGSSADGLSVMLETLRRLELPTSNIALVNGSGLFQGNRVTSALISKLLAAMYKNPSLRDDFVAQLAVGGADGTIARRFRTLPAPRIVRAKTGTLNDVIALSGYVLGPQPERAYAFSFLANGVTGKHSLAKDFIDQTIAAIAAELFGQPLPSP